MPCWWVLVTGAESAADRVAHLLGTCLAAVRDHLGTVAAEGAAVAGGLVTVGGTLLPVLAHLMGAFVRTAGRRRRHLASLAVVARPGADDTVVLDHPVAAAYCLPSGEVVVTTGAIESLTSRELRAALAHERAHLRHRHHLLLTGASACARALPFVPLLRGAAVELPGWSSWPRMTPRRCVVGAGSSRRHCGSSRRAPVPMRRSAPWD